MNDLKLGTVIDLEGQPFQLVFSQHVKMGRGGAVLKTKLKNLITGNQLEKTFKGGDSIYLADLQHGKANYLYTDGEGVHFMNNESYDQFFLSPETVGDKKKYLKEGSDVDMLLFNDNPVAIELPKKVEFEVTSAPGSERGDTTQGGATKEVELENGSTIKTPLFIKTGDTVRINTDTGDYVERV